LLFLLFPDFLFLLFVFSPFLTFVLAICFVAFSIVFASFFCFLTHFFLLSYIFTLSYLSFGVNLCLLAFLAFLFTDFLPLPCFCHFVYIFITFVLFLVRLSVVLRLLCARNFLL